MHALILVLSSVLVWLSIVLLAVSGCGTGGKEDDTQSSSSASTEVTQCGDITFTVTEEQLAELLEDAEEAGDEVEIEDLGTIPSNDGGLDQQTRLYNVKLLQIGCGNTGVTEDNDSSSDDDISTSVEIPQGEE